MDTPYKLIQIDGQAALIEVDGKRRSVPASELEEFSQEVFEAGVPYGVPWADLLDFCFTGEDLEKELHARGIYTAGDLLQNPQRVRGAVNKVVGDVFGALIDIAKRHKEV